MSIALEARVAELEYRVKSLEIIANADSQLASNFAEEIMKRLSELEQTAARKPGPKPKDSNG